MDQIHNEDNMEEMTEKLNAIVSKTLDECAPIKSFKVREQHKFGLSEKTRQSMKARDQLRKGEIKMSKSLLSAKAEIKKICVSLPL